MLVAGDVDQVAAERLKLQRKAEGRRVTAAPVTALRRIVVVVVVGKKALSPLPVCPNTWVRPAGRCPRG